MRWMVGRTRTEQEQGGGRGGGVSCIPLYFFRHPPQFLFPDDLPSSSVLPQYDAPEKYIDIYMCVCCYAQTCSSCSLSLLTFSIIKILLKIKRFNEILTML